MHPVGNIQGMYPHWSPDGKQLVYTRSFLGGGLYAADIDGTNETELLGRNAAMGVWSPDGASLAYVIVEGDTASLYVANADGSKSRRMAGGRDEMTLGPRWSSDSKRVYFTWREKPKTPDPGDGFAFDFDTEPDYPAPSAVHVIGANGQGLRRVTQSDLAEYCGQGDFLFVSAPSYDDRAARRLPTTSWRGLTKTVPPLLPEEKAVAEWLESVGARFQRNESKPGHPIYSIGMASEMESDKPSQKVAVTDDDYARLTALKELIFLYVGGTKLTDEGLKHIGKLKSLRDLDLAYTAVTNDGMRHLTGCENLVMLRLAGTKVDDEGFKHLRNLSSLESIVFDEAEITDGIVQGLKEIDKFLPTGSVQLVFRYSKITDVGLKQLADLTSLEYLDLEHTAITDAGLKELANLKKLKSLNLASTKVTDAGLQHLAGLKALEFLVLRKTAVTHQGVTQLRRKLPKLAVSGEMSQPPRTPSTQAEKSAIAWVTSIGGGINGSLPSEIGGPPNEEEAPLSKLEDPLNEIDLRNRQVTDADLRTLAKFGELKNLHRIDLSGTNVTDAGMKHLAKFGSLQSLDLGDTKVSDSGLAVFARLKNLQLLNLTRTNVKGTGLTALSGLKNLHILSVRGNQLESSGLQGIASLKQLRTLDLDGTNLKPADIKSLSGLRHLTDLRVELLADIGNGQNQFDEMLLALRDANLLYAIPQCESNTLTLETMRPRGSQDVVQLDLRAIALTDKGLRAFADFKNVKEIIVSDKRITDAGMKQIKGFPKLVRLDLSGTSVTDRGLADVAQVTGLESLNLEGTRVTDAGLKKLLQLTKLRHLGLFQTKVTKTAVDELRDAIPKIRIQHPQVRY